MHESPGLVGGTSRWHYSSYHYSRHTSSDIPSERSRLEIDNGISMSRPSRTAVANSPLSSHMWQVLTGLAVCGPSPTCSIDTPRLRADATRIDHMLCTATGAIACNSAVVCVHARGPANNSRTLALNPRVIYIPSNFL